MTSKGPNHISGGALVINITTEWLREVFRDVDPLHSQLVFVDGQGSIAYHTNPSLFLKNIADTPIFTQMVQNKDDAGYFLLETEGKKSYVFYSKSQDSPLFLLRIYPYSAIMGGIIMLRRSTLILVMLCILIALALAAIMSRKLYKPIRLLVRRLDTTHERPREQDELGYLSTSIERMVTEAESFEETTHSYRKLLQTDVLREVLLGKIGDPTLVLDQFNEYKLPFAPDVPYQIIGLHPFSQALREQVGRHLMGVQFDKSLLLVTQNCLSPQIQVLADQAIANGCRLVVVSRFIDHPYQLSRRAFRILEELRFSFVHERGTVLEERELTRSLTSGPYPTDLEKSVINHLQRGQSDEAYALYQEFFSQVSRYSFNHFRFAMKRFYISLQLLIKELQDTGCFFSFQEEGIESFEDSLDTIQERATLDIFFRQWFDRFRQAIQHYKDQKNKLVAMQVKALVEREYHNPNVCLQYVADAVQLSPTYLSKIFKASEGISFGDYFFSIRMKKASALLSETETPIREIATAVGFSNENYFYTVFRKQVGFTPNEFRQQDRLQ
ncbi:MAG: helix-turn-helix domain-containing protein [Sphaerochaeta sp.]|nr:helix-turn-helix domain-containing protein [Sphaerochaeta sp.]